MGSNITVFSVLMMVRWQSHTANNWQSYIVPTYYRSRVKLLALQYKSQIARWTYMINTEFLLHYTAL
jgi:hypothetical protein